LATIEESTLLGWQHFKSQVLSTCLPHAICFGKEIFLCLEEYSGSSPSIGTWNDLDNWEWTGYQNLV